MKRFYILALFPLLIIGLLASGKTYNKSGNTISWSIYKTTEQDTTGLIRLIDVDSFRLNILPPSSGVQFFKDGIVFLSRSKNEEKMITIHTSFGIVEAYYASLNDTLLGKQTIFSQSPAFSYPCESTTFTPDFQTMYYSMIPKKGNKEKIFIAKFIFRSKKKSGWLSDNKPLAFCTGNFTYSHPTLSADENLLIFASDRAGSLGGMDLFITRKEGNIWSDPENLGKLINTPGNEFFPYLDSDNNLFFSSDGLDGFGGYDIYTCKFNGETWNKPQNLSNRINSKDDDIAFTINKTDGKTAFYTNRPISGKGDMQLFRVTLDKEDDKSNLLTISYIFNGEPLQETILKTEKTLAEVPGKSSEIITPESKNQPVDKKELTKVAEPLPTPLVTDIPTQPVVDRADTNKDIPTVKSDNKKDIVYRIQFLSTTSSRGNFTITVARNKYDTYEYFYKGAYRYTIGEFSTLAPAVVLQNLCRRSGYEQAFVTAFINNERSLDPALFK
jgi:hypothetical protein